jgi:hypothetical protein
MDSILVHQTDKPCDKIEQVQKCMPSITAVAHSFISFSPFPISCERNFAGKGFTVLQLLPYHCDLNTIISDAEFTERKYRGYKRFLYFFNGFEEMTLKSLGEIMYEKTE